MSLLLNPSRFLDWAFPVPDDDYADRRGKFADGLRFRAVVSVAFALLFLALGRIVPGPRPPMDRLLPILGTLALVNLPYWYLGIRSNYSLRQFYFHWCVDLFLISNVLFLLGGIDVPYGLLAYLMIVVTSATFLSKRASFMVATGAALTTLGLALLQNTGVVQPPRAWAGESTFATRFIAVTAATVFYYVFAYLAGTLADQLKAVNVNLQNARSEIEKQNRLLEDKVLSRTQELQNRNSEIEEFVHIVTHDLKNVSIGAIETARLVLTNNSGELNERTRRYLGHLLEDTTQMNAMLVHLLELFKIDERKVESSPINLQGVAADLVRSFAQRIENQHLEVIVGTMPEVRGDETQLRHVLGNLLDNAIKYTPAKESAEISLQCDSRDSEWVLSVRDEGIGIAPAQIDRIFQLYFRGSNVKAAGEGRDGDGVGLAICKRIVERWGGQIWVESELGRGSCFRFSIPHTIKTV